MFGNKLNPEFLLEEGLALYKVETLFLLPFKFFVLFNLIPIVSRKGKELYKILAKL